MATASQLRAVFWVTKREAGDLQEKSRLAGDDNVDEERHLNATMLHFHWRLLHSGSDHGEVMHCRLMVQLQKTAFYKKRDIKQDIG